MIHTIDIFRLICELSVVVVPHPEVHSIRYIANRCNISKYQATVHIHRHKKYGLIQRSYVGGATEDGLPHCYHGWTLID